MPRLIAKRTVLKKPPTTAGKTAMVKAATKKKSAAKRPAKAVANRKTLTPQAVAPDGIPWPRVPRIYRRGNLTAKQVREAVLRAMAAVEADRLAAEAHPDKAVP